MLGSVRLATTVAAIMLMGAGSAASEAALAIGSTGEISRDGIAIGSKINQATSTSAVNLAMEDCRNQPFSPTVTGQCMLVATFRNECLALALDPQDGTPGVGWAIHSERAVAEQRALDYCKATAGSSRRGACRVIVVECDGSSQG